MNTLYAKLWEGGGRTTTYLRNGKGTRDFDLQESQTEEHISKIFFFPGRTTNIQGALLSDGPFMVPPFWGLLSLMGGSFFPSTRFLSPSHLPSRAPVFALSTSSHANGNSHDTPRVTTPHRWSGDVLHVTWNCTECVLHAIVVHHVPVVCGSHGFQTRACGEYVSWSPFGTECDPMDGRLCFSNQRIWQQDQFACTFSHANEGFVFLCSLRRWCFFSFLVQDASWRFAFDQNSYCRVFFSNCDSKVFEVVFLKYVFEVFNVFKVRVAGSEHDMVKRTWYREKYTCFVLCRTSC